MSKFDIRPEFECQNRISNVKIRYLARIRMSKYDFECQNSIFGLSSDVKIGFECQNSYSARIRMSKYDFECKNSIFGPSSNVKIRF